MRLVASAAHWPVSDRLGRLGSSAGAAAAAGHTAQRFLMLPGQQRCIFTLPAASLLHQHFALLTSGCTFRVRAAASAALPTSTPSAASSSCSSCLHQISAGTPPTFSMAACAALALALLAALALPATAFLFGDVFSGDGTYYGQKQRGFGHCSFHMNDFGGLFPGTPVAINAPQYAGTKICGLCVEYRGVGQGLGGNPIATSWQKGFVCDSCPECKHGDLDLQTNGDGRWKIEWRAIQCPVGGQTFAYGFQGGNPWYRKLQVAGARVPVASVQIMDSGAWKDLIPTIDGFFEAHGDMSRMWSPCAKLRMTSILGDSVEDSVCCSDGTCRGDAQFACNPSVGGCDGGSSGGNNPASSLVGGLVQAAGNAVGGAVGELTGFGGSALRNAGSLRRAATGGLKMVGNKIAGGEQCGGKGFKCGGALTCADAKFPNLFCQDGYKCMRNDAQWWGCKR